MAEPVYDLNSALLCDEDSACLADGAGDDDAAGSLTTLGVGAASCVYLLPGGVARKIVPKCDGVPRRGFDVPAEYAMLRAVQGHPNVMTAISLIDAGAEWYLDSVAVGRGRTLFDFICDTGPVAYQPVLAVSAWAQLTSAVAWCHRRRVIHGDVKLDNALMSHDGTVVLADFGFAHQVDDITADEVFSSGSVDYAAPELFLRDTPHMACAPDSWALGVCFYALLFRDLPFSRGIPNSMSHTRARRIAIGRIMQADVDYNLQLPTGLDASLLNFCRGTMVCDQGARLTPICLDDVLVESLRV